MNGRLKAFFECLVLFGVVSHSLSMAQEMPLAINPSPVIDSIGAGRTQSLAAYRFAPGGPTSESMVIGYSCVKRRCEQRLKIVCNPDPTTILAEAIGSFISSAGAGDESAEIAGVITLSEVKVLFEEKMRRMGRDIRVSAVCTLTVRDGENSAVIRTYSFQAEESKAVISVERNIENVARAVLTQCARQIFLSLSGGRAE